MYVFYNTNVTTHAKATIVSTAALLVSITAAHFSFVNYFLACWYSVLVPLLDSEFEFIHDFSWFVFIDNGPVVFCRSVDTYYHVLCFWQNLFHPDVTIMVDGIKNQLPVCVWTRKCFNQAVPFKMNIYVSISVCVCVCVWQCHLKWIYMCVCACACVCVSVFFHCWTCYHLSVQVISCGIWKIWPLKSCLWVSVGL